MRNNYDLENLIERYPLLNACKADISKALSLFKECFTQKHKMLIAGNGGSCADADHITGELMKGFIMKRPIDQFMKSRLADIDKEAGNLISDNLQCGLPVFPLHNNSACITAFINDINKGDELFFAQQLFVMGNEGDVLLAISTSGNSKNIYNACVVAKAKGLKVVALTGKDGGLLKKIADVSIVVPEEDTFIIQEYHLPIYHYLCIELERYFFKY